MLYLIIPDTDIKIVEKSTLRLNRFDSEDWRLLHGWYSWGGNRPFCGWYLQSLRDSKRVKPVQLPDMYDIYLVTTYSEEYMQDYIISKGVKYHDGDKVIINAYPGAIWELHMGWYTYKNNNYVGWYLIDIETYHILPFTEDLIDGIAPQPGPGPEPTPTSGGGNVSFGRLMDEYTEIDVVPSIDELVDGQIVRIYCEHVGFEPPAGADYYLLPIKGHPHLPIKEFGTGNPVSAFKSDVVDLVYIGGVWWLASQEYSPQPQLDDKRPVRSDSVARDIAAIEAQLPYFQIDDEDTGESYMAKIVIVDGKPVLDYTRR